MMDFVSAFESGSRHRRTPGGDGYPGFTGRKVGGQASTFGEVYANYEVSPSCTLASQRRSFMSFASQTHAPKGSTIKEVTQATRSPVLPGRGGSGFLASRGGMSTPRRGVRPRSQPGTPRQPLSARRSPFAYDLANFREAFPRSSPRASPFPERWSARSAQTGKGSDLAGGADGAGFSAFAAEPVKPLSRYERLIKDPEPPPRIEAPVMGRGPTDPVGGGQGNLEPAGQVRV